MRNWENNMKTVSVMSLDEQKQRLLEEYKRCQLRMAEDPYTLSGLFCNRTWDNILCWPDTPAGRVARQPCPEYINRFDQGEFGLRRCTDNGTWWINPDTHLSWTNYSACAKSSDKMIPQLIKEHMPGIKLMYTIGYSLSLTALILALIIMVYFKRLHCPRNVIHMNMFLAFGVRAAFSLMKTVLLVNDLAFANDVNQTRSEVNFLKAGHHWECKLFFTLFYYIIFASVMWLFNEGLYLQLILSISVFSDKAKVRWFVLVGWGIPLGFVMLWVLCRVYLDDMLCWNVHLYRALYWIIHGPMIASVAFNFVIFINIVRMLFTKLRAANCSESKINRYRKLAKSTLILIPLFAVYYILFMLLPDDVNTTVDLFKTYVEMLFNSFQGFLVALLFCFLNHEVQHEIRTKWHRRSLQKTASRSPLQLNHSFFHRFSPVRNNQSHEQVGKQDAMHGSDTNIIKSKLPPFEEQYTDAYIHKLPANIDRKIPQITQVNSDQSYEVVQPLVLRKSHQSMADINITEVVGDTLDLYNKDYECLVSPFLSCDSHDVKFRWLSYGHINCHSEPKPFEALSVNNIHSQSLDTNSNTGKDISPVFVEK